MPMLFALPARPRSPQATPKILPSANHAKPEPTAPVTMPRPSHVMTAIGITMKTLQRPVFPATQVTNRPPIAERMVSTGNAHSCSIKADGSVWCSGRNHYGQLGDGTTTNSTIPVKVSGLTDVISVSAGDEHTCAVKSDNSLWCWGSNDEGQLGGIDDTSVPLESRF